VKQDLAKYGGRDARVPRLRRHGDVRMSPQRVGGGGTEEKKIERSKKLAARVLRKL